MATTTNLNYIKMPRNVAEYTLMKGVTDFSNLKQFDVFETGYSFLTVVSVPKFMTLLAKQDPRVNTLQEGFIHILEGEFRGISGLPDITADAGTIENGVNQLQIINNVSMETAIQVDMTFWERSGGLITNYLAYYLTGIKDPYSKAKTYHGLIESQTINDPGPDQEVFTFLYMVTDNTCRKLEKAFLLANAQPISAPYSTLYNSQRGTMDFQEISVTFNCYPIVSSLVNKYAAMILQHDLTTDSTDYRKLVLDSNDYEFHVYGDKMSSRTITTPAGTSTTTPDSLVSDILEDSSLESTVNSLYDTTGLLSYDTSSDLYSV